MFLLSVSHALIRWHRPPLYELLDDCFKLIQQL